MRAQPISDRRWDEDYFLQVRQQVLGQWPTGKSLADPGAVEEAIDYQRGQPRHKVVAHRNGDAEREGRVQITLQVGHALTEQVIDHIRHCDVEEPDCWFVYQDTYTRKNRYQEAQGAVVLSRERGVSVLNGYPIVCHGVAGVREVNEATEAALRCNCCDADPRLAWEIALAGGWTAGTNGPLNQSIQHERDVPPELAIWYFQYQDRLAAFYTERGAPIVRTSVANLPGWDVPGMRVSIGVLQALLAARQGVKHMEIWLGLGMNLLQDVAAMRAAGALARGYLQRLGYEGIEPYVQTFPWLGDWPQDRDAAAAMIAWNAAVSAMGGANLMVLKSLDEAFGTPTREATMSAIKIARQIARITQQQSPDTPALDLERDMITREAGAIVDRVLELGEGDVALGCVRGVKSGVLDAMFSPWRQLKGKVLAVRDINGALRYLEPGDVPLPAEVAEYHREKIAERERAEGVQGSLQWVIQAATRMSAPTAPSHGPV